MTAIKTFAFVVGAAELLSKGVDISILDHKRFVDREEFSGDNEYRVKIDAPTKEMFKLDSDKVIRTGTIVKTVEDKNFEPNLSLSVDKVKQIMQVLWEANIEYFSDFNERDFVEGYDKIIEKFDRDFNRELEMQSKLSRDNTDSALKIFLALFNYQNGYSKKLYDDSKIDKDIESLVCLKEKDVKVVDNRLYIYIKPSDFKKIEREMLANGVTPTPDMRKIKAFVISKNVYDYFWASYGNKFQSCFSLNSEYGYLYGYVPFAMAEESFICYATTGSVNKIPIISGKQFPCPNMLWRCWGYPSENKELLIDKRYPNSGYDNEVFIDACINVLKSKIELINDNNRGIDRTLLNKGKNIAKIQEDLNGYFYADSLRIKDDKSETFFRFAGGTCGTGNFKAPWQQTHKRFITYASTITGISDTLTLDKPCKVINGVLLNPKVCPTTGFFIDESESKSPYAKFYTKDCKESCVLTYINGCVFCDLCTKDCVSSAFFHIIPNPARSYSRDFAGGKLYIYGYNSGSAEDFKGISLKSLKEHIKGHIDTTGLDGILLRYFEGSEIKYQFYKGK